MEEESIYNYLQVKETDRSVVLSTNVMFGVQSIKMKEDGLTAYAAEDRILTDDKAPVEVLGMRELDRIIGRELDNIQEIYQTEGVSGLLELMG